MTLPKTTTPAELAKHLGWSERRVRSEAKRIGACLIMGNRMVLTETESLPSWSRNDVAQALPARQGLALQGHSCRSAATRIL